jgi:hypothetical protein
MYDEQKLYIPYTLRPFILNKLCLSIEREVFHVVCICHEYCNSEILKLSAELIPFLYLSRCIRNVIVIYKSVL